MNHLFFLFCYIWGLIKGQIDTAVEQLSLYGLSLDAVA